MAMAMRIPKTFASHGLLMLAIFPFHLCSFVTSGVSSPRFSHGRIRRTSNVVRAEISRQTVREVNPVDVASNLLALLGSEAEAKTVEPSLSSKLYGCLHFLVPDGRRRTGVRRPFNQETRLLSEVLGDRVRDKRINELIWWPPKSVRDLAREAVESKGERSVLERALNNNYIQVPDFENCKEDNCQLTRTDSGRRFVNKELNLYMAFLFETIHALAPLVGFNVSLNRYDLFHGHLFLATNTSRLGILFHAKEYPAYNNESFPYNLGYCQKGSNLPYDCSINLRNILWLAPFPDFPNEQHSFKWLAPGVLVVLDAKPGGIIYEDLLSEWVQEFRTIYEDDFGDVIMDVNYLNCKGFLAENKILIC